MRMSFLFVLILCLAALPARTAAQDDPAKADAITGQWTTAGGLSTIEIYRCGQEYCGKIVWLKEPEKDGKPKVDENNPDQSLKSRPLLGLEILRGFTFDGEDVWRGGKIYDPKSGNDYSAKMTLVDEHTMELRGYVLMPLFGRTETWTR